MALREFFYGDESGIHDNAPYCLVAGYRGSPGQWKPFNTEWRAVLKKPEYRITNGFHSNVFFNRKKILDPKANPYFGWPDVKADLFVGELLSAIRRRQIYPCGCVVNVADFKALTYGEQSELVGYTPPSSIRQHRANPQPYHLTFRLMLEDVIKGTTPNTEIHFVLGIQKNLQQRAIDGFKLTKELGLGGYANQLKGIAFEEPLDFPGLQAADLLVHQWNNSIVRGHPGQFINTESRHVMTQLTHNRDDLPACDAERIEQIFELLGLTGAAREEVRAMQRPS